MIVGDGMIASAVKKIDRDDVLFFCSGVSNSNELSEESYLKEKNLLKQYLNTQKCLIYFGSYFVCFEHYLSLRYYRHKMEMENLIKQNSSLYKIFRLPQVVGNSNNKYTLTNFLFNAIIQRKMLYLHKNARRKLVDIDDIVSIICYINDNDIFCNETINLVPTNSYSIFEIVSAFEEILNIKALFVVQDYNEVNVDDSVLCTQEIKNIFDKFGVFFDDLYLKQVIKKYYC